MEAALNTTQNYINEILNSEGHGADPRLVNCLVRNQFNLRQINILLNSLNGNNDHKLNFKSDLKITNSSMTPSIEESFGIYIIPIIFFFLTILFCLYRFAIHKN